MSGTDIHLDFVLDAPQGNVKDNDTKSALRTLENMLAEITSQTTKEEEEYKAEQNTHKNVIYSKIQVSFLLYLYFLNFLLFLKVIVWYNPQILQELNYSKRKLSLIDTIIEETKAFQDLTLYPY